MTIIDGVKVPAGVSQDALEQLVEGEVSEATEGIADPELRDRIAEVVRERVLRDTSAQLRAQAAMLDRSED